LQQTLRNTLKVNKCGFNPKVPTGNKKLCASPMMEILLIIIWIPAAGTKYLDACVNLAVQTAQHFGPLDRASINTPGDPIGTCEAARLV
jgi:hypothetical protein